MPPAPNPLCYPKGTASTGDPQVNEACRSTMAEAQRSIAWLCSFEIASQTSDRLENPP